jgi:hypothetical protein
MACRERESGINGNLKLIHLCLFHVGKRQKPFLSTKVIRFDEFHDSTTETRQNTFAAVEHKARRKGGREAKRGKEEKNSKSRLAEGKRQTALA